MAAAGGAAAGAAAGGAAAGGAAAGAAAPVFEEHVCVARVTESSIHAIDRAQFEELVRSIRSLESLEGVLAIHIGIAPGFDGRPTYVQHFRTADRAARERLLLAAHEVHASHLLKNCATAKALHGKVEDPRAQAHHSALHKLSSLRPNHDFYETAHIDWEGHPVGSHCEKFPAVRLIFVKYNDGTSAKLIADHMHVVQSLSVRFSLVKQVSLGKNIAHTYADSLLYPEGGLIHWDLGIFLGFESARDRAELDALPELINLLSQWQPILGALIFNLDSE